MACTISGCPCSIELRASEFSDFADNIEALIGARAVIANLLEWAAQTGEWDAPAWERAKAFMDKG